jgi:hypothetical protein
MMMTMKEKVVTNLKRPLPALCRARSITQKKQNKREGGKGPGKNTF